MSAINDLPRRNISPAAKASTFASNKEENHVDQIIAQQVKISHYCRARSDERCNAGSGPVVRLPREPDA
jgi:hypothetical protein